MNEQKPLGSGFGAKSTALEVVARIDLIGKWAVVAGGYSGIGTETVRGLRRAKANVVVPARRVEAAEQNLAGLGVRVAEMGLATIASVRAYACSADSAARLRDMSEQMLSRVRARP